MSFEHPWILILLLLAVLPVLLVLRSFRIREERMKAYAESAFAGQLLIGANTQIRWIRALLVIAALLFLILAAAGPQINGGKEVVKMRGIDLVVAVDVSTSMLATDLKPNRIEKAKQSLSDLLTLLEGDRLGVVVFAGRPITNLPLCEDRGAAEMIISSISTESVSVQGTAVGAAIDKAIESFTQSEEGRGKAIILISDGENHEDDAIEAAQRAAEKGIIVCTVGIGSTEGTTIPVTDESGNVGTKKDMNGQTVITKLNDQILKDVARAGNGTYVRATNEDLGLTTIMGQLRNLSKTTKESVRYSSFTPIFYFGVIVAIALLVLELFITEGIRSNKTEVK